jgi:hypothetical protein
MENVPAVSKTVYDDLEEDAKAVLRRALFMSGDEKLATRVALDILKARNEGSVGSGQQIVIKDSQIQLLMTTAREAFGG